MKRLEYLLKATELHLYREKRWWFSAFAIATESDEAWKEDPYEGRVVRQPWGYGFVENGEIVKIEDADVNKPLFAMMDPMIAKKGMIENLFEEQVETSVGAFLCNKLLLTDYYGPKIKYMAYSINIEKVEEFIINNRAVDLPGVPRDPTKIYLDEYIKMGQAVEMIRTLGWLSSYSLTEKNMVKPDGIDEFKKELLKKYTDLSDPVQLANFERELVGYSDKWLADDPSFGKMASGKIRSNAIRKMTLSSGAEGGMGTPMVPIVESLADGQKYTPESLQALINGARSGSYFRGLDTVKGGVSFKLAVRVLGSFFVGEEDCKTKLGLHVTYDKTNINQLVNRRLIGKEDKPIQNLQEAGNYLDKPLVLRTPGRCLSKSSVICRTCAGSRLTHFPEGLAIPASDETGIILAASMAAMHKNTTEVAIFDLETAMSLSPF